MFDEVLVYAIPMRIRFRGIDTREGVLVYRRGSWREWSPFTEYDDQEASRWLRAALEDEKPAPIHARIPINVTVPVVAPEQAFDLVRRSGAHTAKVKVADPRSALAEDLARLAAVREALGEAGSIRVDANGAWDVPTALHALGQMSDYRLQYAEQPCARVDELARLRAALADRQIPVPIAADESIRRASDPYRVVREQAADVMILKNQPLGGARICVRLQDELGLPAVMSSALETSVGIWAGLRAAAALPGVDMACGLGTVALLADDVVAQPLVPRDGFLRIDQSPPGVDERAFGRCRADEERRSWWQARLVRCLEIVKREDQ